MTNADRLYRWNAWYDGLPEQWRFQVVLWPLLLIGAINMIFTIASGFPFGLLVVIALIALIVVRVPYNVGWLKGPEGPAPDAHGRTVSLGRIDWAYDLNVRYDAMPEWRRFWVIPGILIVAGAINMGLTLAGAFPFALLFLLALLAVVAWRAPYVWGWITPPPGRELPAPDPLRVTHEGPSTSSIAFPWVGAQAAPVSVSQPHTIEHEHIAPAPAPIAEPPAHTEPAASPLPANDPEHH